VRIPHTNPLLFPQQKKIINQWLQVHINIVTRLLRSEDKHQYQNELPLHTQPRRKIVYTKCHKPSTMATALFLKGFMPSVLKPNLTFLASSAKVGNVLSTFLH
jgi:hypothetical protein